MEQYIKKSALVAEIKTRIETYNKGYANGDDCRADALETFLHDIDFLEVKEADLYEELDVYFAQFKGLEKSYWNWRIDSINIHAQGIYDFAKHFFELGLKAQKGEEV